MPATVASLRVYLGIAPASTNDEEAMGQAVAAANDAVTNWRPDWTGTEPWRPLAEQAALTQAARWYGRRGSVPGIAAFADIGVMTLPRMDPDVMVMLELGNYQRSVVA